MKRRVVLALEIHAGTRTCGGPGGRWCRFFSQGSERSSCYLFHCVLLSADDGAAHVSALARRAAHELGVSHRWGDTKLNQDDVARAVSAVLPAETPPCDPEVLHETYQRARDRGAAPQAPQVPASKPPPHQSLRCRACTDAEAVIHKTDDSAT